MAKAATATQEVARTTGNMPAAMADRLKADAGRGFQNVTQADKVIPFVSIAQKMSPELDERDAQHIKGLKEGDFFSKATGKIWPGMTGFSFVPVLYQMKFLEWVPREKGGGFAGERTKEDFDKCAAEERGGKFGNWLPNGNVISRVATWYGMIIDKDTGEAEQAVLALASTQIKKSKQLNSKLDMVKTDVNGQRVQPPMWFNIVDIKTAPEKNDKGSWYGWQPSLDGNIFSFPWGTELYDAGDAFELAVKAGTVKTEIPMTDVSEGAGDSDKM